MYAFLYRVGKNCYRFEIHPHYECVGQHSVRFTRYVSNKIEARNLAKVHNVTPWNF